MYTKKIVFLFGREVMSIFCVALREYFNESDQWIISDLMQQKG